MDRRRIAVIDSGVHPAHSHIVTERLLPGLSVLADGTTKVGGRETMDKLGHGTAVTAAIQELAPQAEVLPIRVFRDALKASAKALARAVVLALEHECQLINLSLGTTNPQHAEAFALLAEETVAQGALIVAAFETAGQPCWPGCLPDVLGVGLDWDQPRGIPRIDAGSDVVMASGYPRPIPGVEPRRNIYGVSFAVAQVTGWIAAQGIAPDRDRVLAALRARRS